MKATWSQKREVMRGYDSMADIYDSRYALEQESKYKVALESIRLSGVVLDVGCGSGLFFKHVSTGAILIVGIDSSRGLLLKAQKNSYGRRNVHLIRADADYLPLKDNLFNAVFAFTILQNMPKPVVTLKELGRVAKPDAQLVVTGLKKVFSMDSLHTILKRSGLSQVSLIDDDALSCYVVVSLKCSK